MSMKSMHENDPRAFMERAKSHNEFSSMEGDPEIQREILENKTEREKDIALNLEEVLLPNENSSP
eukprot:CAMPEP_0170548496 /NCGR_PEP_ID=MMETSP0211-20121228/6812_1 /TAXON_ID=311385 /ORGANISM="Pseudokeronopsis sp., Strain OXSARD2" /LENGTH=64 /DNA_ID=CAMNT_0010854087 /DNA_START=1690 /DNA_END=1884 /DNA_ORIENTATION=+